MEITLACPYSKTTDIPKSLYWPTHETQKNHPKKYSLIEGLVLHLVPPPAPILELSSGFQDYYEHQPTPIVLGDVSVNVHQQYYKTGDTIQSNNIEIEKDRLHGEKQNSVPNVDSEQGPVDNIVQLHHIFLSSCMHLLN